MSAAPTAGEGGERSVAFALNALADLAEKAMPTTTGTSYDLGSPDMGQGTDADNWWEWDAAVGFAITLARSLLHRTVASPTDAIGVGDRVQRISDGTEGTVTETWSVPQALEVEWDFGIWGSANADDVVRLVSGAVSPDTGSEP